MGHDPSTLPHLHSVQEMRRLFSVLGAPPLGANVDEWETENDRAQEVRGVACGPRRSTAHGVAGSAFEGRLVAQVCIV